MRQGFYFQGDWCPRPWRIPFRLCKHGGWGYWWWRRTPPLRGSACWFGGHDEGFLVPPKHLGEKELAASVRLLQRERSMHWMHKRGEKINCRKLWEQNITDNMKGIYYTMSKHGFLGIIYLYILPPAAKSYLRLSARNSCKTRGHSRDSHVRMRIKPNLEKRRHILEGQFTYMSHK